LWIRKQGSTAELWDQDGLQRNSHPPQRYIREHMTKEYDVTNITLQQTAVTLTHLNAALNNGNSVEENSNDRQLKKSGSE